MARPESPPIRLAVPALRLRQGIYASGNLGKNIVWTVFETILLYYLIAIAGLSPGLAGATLTAAALLDAGGTLVIGYLVDRHGRPATLRRFATIGAPLCGVAFAAVFAAGLAGPSAAPILVVACLACRGCYTVCDIAHNTLLVRVAPAPRDAGFVSGLRLMSSAVGAALVGAVATPLLALTPAQHQRHWFLAAAAGGGLVYALLVPAATRAALRFPARAAVATHGRPDLRRAAGALAGDGDFRRLAVLIALQAGLVPLIGKGLPFMLAASGRADRIGTALFVLTAAQAATLPLWTAMAARATPRRMLIVGHALTLAGMLALAATRGGLPGVAIAGAGMASMNLGLWATIAGQVRACADRAGLRLETVAMSLSLFVLKVAAGCATGGLALAVAAGQAAGGRAVTLLTVGGPMLGTAACLALAIAPTLRARRSRRRAPAEQPREAVQGA